MRTRSSYRLLGWNYRWIAHLYNIWIRMSLNNRLWGSWNLRKQPTSKVKGLHWNQNINESIDQVSHKRLKSIYIEWKKRQYKREKWIKVLKYKQQMKKNDLNKSLIILLLKKGGKADLKIYLNSLKLWIILLQRCQIKDQHWNENSIRGE